MAYESTYPNTSPWAGGREQESQERRDPRSRAERVYGNYRRAKRYYKWTKRAKNTVLVGQKLIAAVSALIASFPIWGPIVFFGGIFILVVVMVAAIISGPPQTSTPGQDNSGGIISSTVCASPIPNAPSKAQPISCNGIATSPTSDGYYRPTYFGCNTDNETDYNNWLDCMNNKDNITNYPNRSDRDNYCANFGDNCSPACSTSSIPGCQGKSGKDCEEFIQYFSANKDQYGGCGKKLMVTNTKTGAAVVVMTIEAGPQCRVQSDEARFDMSPDAEAVVGTGMVKVDPVDSSTPLGPVTAGQCSSTGGSGGTIGGSPNNNILSWAQKIVSQITPYPALCYPSGVSGGVHWYNVMESTVTNGAYTALKRSGSRCGLDDYNGAESYFCSDLVHDAYNLAGIKFSRWVNVASQMIPNWESVSGMKVQRSDDVSNIQLGDAIFWLAGSTASSAKHTDIVSSMDVNPNTGNGSLTSIDSNLGGGTTRTYSVRGWHLIGVGEAPNAWFGLAPR